MIKSLTVPTDFMPAANTSFPSSSFANIPLAEE
jgi:hypothetical protein